MLHFRGFSILVVAACLAVSASTARAQEAEAQDLDSIREMVLYARYGEAIQAVEQYLERDDLSARDRNAALEVLATAQLATRNRAANETLALLYSRDPQHRLGDQGASPTVQAAFQRAAEDTTQTVQPELLHETPELVERRAPVLEVRLGEHGDAVDEVRIAYRQQGEASFASLLMPFEEGVARARLPLAEGSEAYVAEYYLEARAPSGAVLTRLGTAAEPLALDVPEAAVTTGGNTVIFQDREAPPRDEGGGVLSQWWFWTAVAVVIAGGVTAGILLSSGDEAPPQGTLGTFTLE